MPVTLVPKGPDKDVLEVLRSFIEAAERGDVVQIAIVGGNAEGVTTGYSGDYYTLVGMLETLKLEILADE